MAYTFKSKRMAYDNISAGNAAGGEHLLGSSADLLNSTVPGLADGTTRQSVETLGVSADCVNSSFITNRPVELPMGGLVSNMNIHAAGVDQSPSSATTPNYTSTTSWTSAINELLG